METGAGAVCFVHCSGVGKAREAAPCLGSAFQHQTIGVKMSNVFKPPLYAHGFYVKIPRDTSAPFLSHGFGSICVDA
jgi:hypothetical protein